MSGFMDCQVYAQPYTIINKEEAAPKGPGAIGKPLARSTERGTLSHMVFPNFP